MPAAGRTLRLSSHAWQRLQRLAEREGVSPEVAAEWAVEWALQVIAVPEGDPAPGGSVLDSFGDARRQDLTTEDRSTDPGGTEPRSAA